MSPEARRDQLIELGLSMVARHPLDQVTIDAIAEEAGVSRALLFHYFSSKQDFHVAIARAQGEQMLKRTAPDFTLGDPMAVLRGSMSAYVDYVSEYQSAYLAFIRGTTSSDPAMRETIDTTRAAMAQRIFDAAPTLGLQVTPAIEMVVFGWLSFVEETTMHWLSHRAISRDELLTLITDSLPALAFGSTVAHTS